MQNFFKRSVLEVVVEGAVGNVGGEGREGVLRGERTGVGDIVPGGVPYVLGGTQCRGRRGGIQMGAMRLGSWPEA